MSDDNGDAAGTDDELAPKRDSELDAMPAGTLARSAADDPMGDPRLDTIHRTLSTLGMRIDALVTSTTTYRSALTDRLAEYADLVSKLTRTQAADLEEYRRANERTVADLRRSLAGSDEVLERVGARLDSMLTDSESSDDSSRRMLAEVRGILDAQENLGRFLTESLDQFGERVMGQVTSTQSAADEQFTALRALVEAGGGEALTTSLTPLREGVKRIETQLADVTVGDERTLDRLAGVEDRIAFLTEHGPAPLADGLGTLRSAVDLLASAEQVSDLSAALREQITDTVGALDGAAVNEQLARIERELDSTGQVAAESWGEFAGLRAKVDAILETSANETGAVSGLLDEVREALIDTASGEVVGALWDEVRDARQTLDTLVGGMAAAEQRAAQPVEQLVPEAARLDDADAERIERLQQDVGQLTSAVRDLLEQAEVVDDGVDDETGGVLSVMAGDIASLRADLAEGLVVEPSDALSGTVDQLRVDVAGLDRRIGEMADMRAGIDAISTQLANGSGSGADSVATLEAVLGELASLRSELGEGLIVEPSEALTGSVDQIRADIAQIDSRMAAVEEIRSTVEALRVAAEADPAPSASVEPDGDVSSADIEGELQTVRTGIEGVGGDLRSVRTGIEDIIARLDEGLVLADDLPVPSDPSNDVSPGIDAETIELLRDEIRASAGASDDLVETLAKELKALRRRIRLRAEGELFSTEQLEVIAAAVARRLAE